jgi:hypothetical protein
MLWRIAGVLSGIVMSELNPLILMLSIQLELRYVSATRITVLWTVPPNLARLVLMFATVMVNVVMMERFIPVMMILLAKTLAVMVFVVRKKPVIIAAQIVVYVVGMDRVIMAKLV